MEGEALSGIGFAKALTEEVRQSPDPINDGIKGRACLGRKPDVFDPGSNLFADFRRLLLAIVLVDLGGGGMLIGNTDPWCIGDLFGESTAGIAADGAHRVGQELHQCVEVDGVP